jgi:hypothetical protein
MLLITALPILPLSLEAPTTATDRGSNKYFIF